MIVETYTHEGVQVQIHVDEEGGEYADPRDNANLGTMVCWHPDYMLGDEQFTNPEGRGAVKRDHNGSAGELAGKEFRSMEHLRRYLGIVREGVCILPLSIYDHSGVTMYVGGRHDFPFDSAGWDTTHVGFIYTTHERVNELCGGGGYVDENGKRHEYHSEEWLETQLAAEVEEYAKFLRGEVYGYIVAADTTDEDSCWGFIGDDVVKEAANESAAGVAEDRRDATARIHAEHVALLG